MSFSPLGRPGSRSSVGTYLNLLLACSVLASSALAASFASRRRAPARDEAPPTRSGAEPPREGA
ncbi:MAG: hypothetical protein U0353_23260 [Sandaracinus sp.]